MEYFKVMYDSRVVNYDCRGFIGLDEGGIISRSVDSPTCHPHYYDHCFTHVYGA